MANGRGRNPERVVREGDWKLLGNPTDRSDKAPLGKDDTLFLANLRMDPTEISNLDTQYPEVVKCLSGLQNVFSMIIQETLNPEP